MPASDYACLELYITHTILMNDTSIAVVQAGIFTPLFLSLNLVCVCVCVCAGLVGHVHVT